jgi:hypothetical protein
VSQACRAALSILARSRFAPAARRLLSLPGKEMTAHMMKSIATFVFAISIAACSKGSSGVTKDSVKDFRDSIRGQAMSLEDATKKGTDKFGPPTRKDDKKVVWAGKDGNECFEFYFEAMSGGTANGTESVDCPK